MSVRIQRAAKRKSADVAPTNPGKYIREFVISTESVDRHNTTFALSGWDLKAYRANPIVLNEHDPRQPPLGKSLSLSEGPGELRAVVEFLPPEVNPETSRILAQIDAGIMGASIGADVKEMRYNKDRESGDDFTDLYLKPPLDFLKQELVELSIVAIGSNRDAVPVRESQGAEVARGIYVSQAQRDIPPDVVYRLRQAANAKRAAEEPQPDTDEMPGIKAVEAPTPPSLAELLKPKEVAPSGKTQAVNESAEAESAAPPPEAEGPTEEEVKAVVQEVAKAVAAELLKYRNQKKLETTGRLP